MSQNSEQHLTPAIKKKQKKKNTCVQVKNYLFPEGGRRKGQDAGPIPRRRGRALLNGQAWKINGNQKWEVFGRGFILQKQRGQKHGVRPREEKAPIRKAPAAESDSNCRTKSRQGDEFGVGLQNRLQNKEKEGRYHAGAKSSFD